MTEPSSTGAPATTPLDRLHRELGARMVAFAGVSLPLQYPGGIIAEHRHTRSRASLFDCSHMGQIRVSGPDSAMALERLVPSDVAGLEPGRQRYTVLTNDAGGIADDLMVANVAVGAGDHLCLVVNAACKARDLELLRQGLGDACGVEPLHDRALLALQGPQAARALARLAPAAGELAFMAVAALEVAGARCLVSRSGYTGEDGFELSAPAEEAEPLARALLDQPEVAPAGLGARDSLRLEAGLCLYGHDLDEHTTPVEAGLAWVIGKARRAGGRRARGFPGAETILRQLATGPPRSRVGLRPEGRAPVREGAALAGPGGRPAGRVTSGGFGPTVEGPVAMGYVEAALARPGTPLQARVRGSERAVAVCPLPFVPHRYRRGSRHKAEV